MAGESPVLDIAKTPQKSQNSVELASKRLGPAAHPLFQALAFALQAGNVVQRLQMQIEIRATSYPVGCVFVAPGHKLVYLVDGVVAQAESSTLHKVFVSGVVRLGQFDVLGTMGRN